MEFAEQPKSDDEICIDILERLKHYSSENVRIFIEGVLTVESHGTLSDALFYASQKLIDTVYDIKHFPDVFETQMTIEDCRNAYYVLFGKPIPKDPPDITELTGVIAW